MSSRRFLVGCLVTLLSSALLAGGLLAWSMHGRFVAVNGYMALDTVTGQACWSGPEEARDGWDEVQGRVRRLYELPLCARR